MLKTVLGWAAAIAGVALACFVLDDAWNGELDDDGNDAMRDSLVA